ncbi:MAG: hypothetical protein ACREA2_04315 [Blastocatellia bacterium]
MSDSANNPSTPCARIWLIVTTVIPASFATCAVAGIVPLPEMTVLACPARIKKIFGAVTIFYREVVYDPAGFSPATYFSGYIEHPFPISLNILPIRSGAK